MQVIGIGRKVFCIVFVIFVFFLVGCQQKEYTPSEEELASAIERRLLKAEKGSFIVFKEKKTIKIILLPNRVKAGSHGTPSVIILEHLCGNLSSKVTIKFLKYKLKKVVYPLDLEYEKYARKFSLQQVGIYKGLVTRGTGN